MVNPAHHSIQVYSQEEDKTQSCIIERAIKPTKELEEKILAEWSTSDLSVKTFGDYGLDVWRSRYTAFENFDLMNCLKEHTIDPFDRSCMVEWLIEVQSKLDCSELTFFKTVAIMDLFYKKSRT